MLSLVGRLRWEKNELLRQFSMEVGKVCGYAYSAAVVRRTIALRVKFMAWRFKSSLLVRI